ncbi:MAG TPA: hypothetical protein VEJ87_04650 [Acidimicrobiales bacterium]|nr:hypothetical protein [Acidimicrobiales bacterium]
MAIRSSPHLRVRAKGEGEDVRAKGEGEDVRAEGLDEAVEAQFWKA